MTTRSDKYRFVQDEFNSRVARNKELYDQLYTDDSYFQDDEKPSQLEKTNEIDVEKVKELLKGREMYRREMKMRELNIIKSEKEESDVSKDTDEEKNYDINAYLNKASSERETEPYHKIDPEILKQPEIEEEKVAEPTIEELRQMGTTALSLDMFSDLAKTTKINDYSEEMDDDSDEDEEDDSAELVATITKTDTFFTDSIKMNLDEEDDEDDEDDEDEDEEKSFSLVKIILVLLVLVIVGLIVFLLFM